MKDAGPFSFEMANYLKFYVISSLEERKAAFLETLTNKGGHYIF